MNNKSVRTQFAKQFSFFMAIPAFVWVFICFYIPLLTIIARSLLTRSPGEIIPHFTPDYYAQLFELKYFHVIWRSLLLAFGTSVSCLLIGYPVAYFLARKARSAKNILLFFLMLPFAVNLLVQAYAWFFVLGKSGLINQALMMLGLISDPLNILNTPVAVYIGMIYCYVPFMIMPLYAVLEKLDQRFVEASFDLGADWFKTMWRVVLPLSMPGIVTGFFLVFIPVFGEFVIPNLLGGNKQMFVGSLISFYFLITRNLAVGSAFTCLSGIIVLTAAVFTYWRLKKLWA